MKSRITLLIRKLLGALAIGLVFGLTIGLTFWLAYGLAYGLAGWLTGRHWLTDEPAYVNPKSKYRLTLLARKLAGGLPGGLVFGLAGGLAGGLASLVANWLAARSANGLVGGPGIGLGTWLVGGLVSGLAGCLTVGLVMVSSGAWLSYLLAVGRLAATGKLPLRLMDFLDDAYRLGLLRTVGPIYQFRHADFQAHLVRAADPAIPRRPDPSPAGQQASTM